MVPDAVSSRSTKTTRSRASATRLIAAWALTLWAWNVTALCSELNAFRAELAWKLAIEPR